MDSRMQFSKLEGVNVISRQDGKATRADSMAVAENILTANPDNVDLFFAITMSRERAPPLRSSLWDRMLW